VSADEDGLPRFLVYALQAQGTSEAEREARDGGGRGSPPRSLADQRLDELRRDLRDDGVPKALEQLHPAGNPMSQRECSGFSWPRFSVAAGEPLAVVPESAASCAATASGIPSARVPDSTSARDFASCSSGVLFVL
jgi:hypothetical protein